MKIGITGSTGQLGRLVIKELRERIPADTIVALARSAGKATELGVEVREADYERPETLEPALAGIDALLLISANEIGQRVRQHHNVIEAAKKAGVGRIVYTSIMRADRSPISLAAEHRETELELIDSGIPYTILRNGWYTENYTGSIPAALAGGAFIGSAGEGRISSAARADYAAAAVEVLTGTGHENRIYELAGDKSYTLPDLAREISRQSGRELPYVDMPGKEYAAVLVKAGLPEEFSGAIAGWDVSASHGALFDDGGQLGKLIGRPTVTLAESVKQALKATLQTA